MKVRVEETKILRQNLISWLETQSWVDEVFASDANFVLFRTPLKTEIFDGLKAQGILIRDQSKQLQLENCLRISIGSKREMDLVQKTMTNLVTNTSALSVQETN